MIPALLLLALLVQAAPATAQEPAAAGPRPEADEGQARFNQEPPEQPGWPRLPIPAVPEDQPLRGFFPLFGSVVQGSHVAAGAGYRDHAFLGTFLGYEVSGMLSLRGYQAYNARLGLLHAARRSPGLEPAGEEVTSLVDDGSRGPGGAAIYLDARYRYYPRDHFYGLGPSSDERDRSDYLVKGPSIDLVFEGQMSERFALSARAGVLETDIDEGHEADLPSTQEAFTPAEAPGLFRVPRYFVAGAGAVFDGRDDVADTRRGFYLSGVAWRFTADGQPQFTFTRLVFDARGFLQPHRSPGIVAVRFFAANDIAGKGGKVPFFMQPGLGGRESLRAFPVGRWRDRALAHATVEYRWRPHLLLEVAPFLDAGVVGGSLRSLEAGHIRVAPGIALRGRWAGLVGRMEAAWGAEGGRLLVGIGQVF